MKVAIFGSRRDDTLDPKVKSIQKVLEDKNIKVDTSYFNLVSDHTRASLDDTYNTFKSILQKNDVIIVESTIFNTGISLIIGRVIELKKPLLILVDEKENTDIGTPVILKAHSEKLDKVFYEEYSEENISEVIGEFIGKTKDLLNTKYLFNLSPEMSRFLQWSSSHYNRPMVETLRELLQERMDSDTDWKEYIKD